MHWRVGIDENGLGSVLGPMVVTACMARVSGEIHSDWDRRSHDLLHARLGDSKGLVGFGDMKLAEAWARAVVARAFGSAGCPNSVLAALAVQEMSQLTMACPQQSREMCWQLRSDLFEASAEQLDVAESDLGRMAEQGVDVVWAGSIIVCTSELNRARAGGRGRFAVDLHAMEELCERAAGQAGTPVTCVCGKVGAMRSYPQRMRLLTRRLHNVLHERRSSSAYQFAGLGEVQFVQDADGADPLVALSSLVGKYVRELLMGRIVGYLRDNCDESIVAASGYNDPVTLRFIRATSKTRRRLGIADDCFARNQAKSIPL